MKPIRLRPTEAQVIANAVLEMEKVTKSSKSGSSSSLSTRKMPYKPYFGRGESSIVRARKKANPAYSSWLRQGSVPCIAAKYILSCGLISDEDLEELGLMGMLQESMSASRISPHTSEAESAAAIGGPEASLANNDVPFERSSGSTGYDADGLLEENVVFEGEVNVHVDDSQSNSGGEESPSYSDVPDEYDTEFNFEEDDSLPEGVASSNEKEERRPYPKSFVEVLRGWSVKYGVSKAALTALITLLLVYRPVINYDELQKIRTGRKLLKVDKKEIQAFLFRDLEDYEVAAKMYKNDGITNPPSDDDEDEDEDLHRIGTTRYKKLGHKYVHFGIENALTGKSPGLVHRNLFFENLKLVDQLEGGNCFSTEFHSLVYGDSSKGKEFMKFGRIVDDAAKKSNDAKQELLFVIDVNIDGIQLFKNSNSAQAYPILGRVFSVGSRKIPINRSPPFLIGMYHGPGSTGPNDKVPLEAFMHDFVTELNRLDPFETARIKDRKCTVSLRLMICDAPMRASLKNVVGHSGYFSCERCRIRGKKKDQNSAVIFPSIDCPHRSDEDWDKYLHPEVSEMKEKKPKVHRKGNSILDVLNFPKIAGFSLDSMHTVDGGVILRAFMFMFGIGKRFTKYKVKEHVRSVADGCIDAWKKCCPYEFARRPRNLKSLHKWKMVEGRTFLMYLSVPMFVLLGDIVSPQFNILKELILGIRLIGGTHLQPVQEKDVDEAECRFRSYFKKMQKLYKDRFCTYKNHCLVHIPDDCRNHDVPMDAMAAYTFENMQKLFINMLRSGKGVLVQIVHGLVAYQKYHIPEEEMTADMRGETFEELLQKVRNNRENLQLPALLPKTNGFVIGRRLQKVVCEGFILTNRFPNNIVSLKEGRKPFTVGVISSFEETDDDGSTHLLVNVREFHSKRPVFQDEYDSGRIGCWRLKSLSSTVKTYSFKAITGKFFACHTNLKCSPDPFKAGRFEQDWVATLLHHSSH